LCGKTERNVGGSAPNAVGRRPLQPAPQPGFGLGAAAQPCTFSPPFPSPRTSLAGTGVLPARLVGTRNRSPRAQGERPGRDPRPLRWVLGLHSAARAVPRPRRRHRTPPLFRPGFWCAVCFVHWLAQAVPVCASITSSLAPISNAQS
jgi:hypothetical protein